MIQKGFTLIELMIVMVIIVILSAIALPQYQLYVNKAKFTEVVAAAAPHKLAVELCSMDVGLDALEQCDSGQHGIADVFDKNANDSEEIGHVGKVEVVDGVITVTAEKKLGHTENPTYQLTPRFTNTSMGWVVGGTCKEAELC